MGRCAFIKVNVACDSSYEASYSGTFFGGNARVQRLRDHHIIYMRGGVLIVRNQDSPWGKKSPNNVGCITERYSVFV